MLIVFFDTSLGNIKESEIPLKMAVDAAQPKWHRAGLDLCDISILLEK